MTDEQIVEYWVQRGQVVKLSLFTTSRCDGKQGQCKARPVVEDRHPSFGGCGLTLCPECFVTRNGKQLAR